MQSRKHIKALPIINNSGFTPKPGNIQVAKKHQYFIVTDIAITGDAPKDFIRYYHYLPGVRKCKVKTWPLFLAKHGHKYYSMEVVAEYLLNRIGEVLGFNMAKSKLAWLGGQVRFLSEYFLSKPQSQVLEHGADLYAGYLNDRDFIEEIEKCKQSSEFFTIEFTETTLRFFFPNDYKVLMSEFIKLLVFDAITGNNDRHFYNWGIIRDVLGKAKPTFSPIYDTARGLFWNEHEKKLKKVYNNKNQIKSFITNYSKNSSPKVSWDGTGKINHFELIEKLAANKYAIDCEHVHNVCKEEKLTAVLNMIDCEFQNLMSIERRYLIKECLKYRHERINNILNFAT